MRDLFQEDKTLTTPENAPPLNAVSVLVPRPLDKTYSYDASDYPALPEGAYVSVEFGRNHYPAVIWGQGAPDIDVSKIKPVLEAYNIPPMPAAHRTFIEWVARYYVAPLGSVLKMAVPIAQALQPEKQKPYYIVNDKAAQGIKKTPPREKLLKAIRQSPPLMTSEIAEISGVSSSVVQGLIKAHVLIEAPPPQGDEPLCDIPAGPELSDKQARAAELLKDAVEAGEAETILLDGVTGSGKTEVYFEAIAAALTDNKQVLLMLPEIALSLSFIKRFQKRFGFAATVWHSGLTTAQRRKNWRAIVKGQARVVIGARSALFLPFKKLGLVVVDEEHEPAYKQEEGVRYHGRDMAVLRGHLGRFPVVLVSATPSLETIEHAWSGKYTHITLPQRFGAATLPEISAIDMRANPPEKGCFIAPPLRSALLENAAKGQQSLLFLNRRGYAPLTLCRACGHKIECPRCTAWLVEHKAGRGLHCHHCDYHMPVPKACPSCGEEESLVPCGPGVERIAEEVQSLFPQLKTMILASDTAEDPATLQEKLKAIHDGQVDIIIGTQVIAKGHHFPGLTLVGVVDADLGLQGGELRASERVYQLLHQVAGRAGREAEQGRVLLQSYMAENAILQALISGDRDLFLQQEQISRQQSAMPPFSRLVGVIIAGRNEQEAFEVAKMLARSAPRGEEIQVLGPAQAPMARIRGRYRFRILIKADKNIDIQKAVRSWIGGHKIPSTVKVAIDVDPQSFM